MEDLFGESAAASFTLSPDGAYFALIGRRINLEFKADLKGVNDQVQFKYYRKIEAFLKRNL